MATDKNLTEIVDDVSLEVYADTMRVKNGGVDEGMLGLTDTATANVSTSKHGFAPKLPNDATKYLNGQGNYTVPAGGGGGGVTVPNLVYNGFMDEYGMAFLGGGLLNDRYPDFWTMYNNNGSAATPTIYRTSGSEAGFGLAFTRIQAADFFTGLEFKLAWLEPSTEYTVKIRARVDTGDKGILATTGASVTQVYEEFTNNTWGDISATFTTDSTPTAVVLQIFGGTLAGGDQIDVEAVGVWEGTTAGAYDRGLPVKNIDISAGEFDFITATLDADSGTNTILRHNFDDTNEEQVRTIIQLPENVNINGRIEHQWLGYSKTVSLGANVKMNAYYASAYMGMSWDNSWSTAVTSGDITTTPAMYWSQDYMETIRWSGLVTDVYSGVADGGLQTQVKLTRSSASSNNLTGDWCGTQFRIRIPLK